MGFRLPAPRPESHFLSFPFLGKFLRTTRASSSLILVWREWLLHILEQLDSHPEPVIDLQLQI